jgi:Ca2+-transporting ATPase
MDSPASALTSWHAKTSEEVFAALGTTRNGLSRAEAEERLKKVGANKLPEEKRRGWFSIFIGQFQSPLIYVLLIADIVVFALKEFTDGSIILFVLLFNSILGAIQEGRAERTLAALKKFAATEAEVIRDGVELTVSDEVLVPGDLITLTEGGKIPADARLVSVQALKVDEAALTGESEPVRKVTDSLPNARSTPEERNMVFKGTTISVGYGRAIVVATGRNTIIGRISTKISQIDTEIPLAASLRKLARAVVWVVLALIAFITATGLLEGKPLYEMFIASVAIAVAAVPEGLPLVLTVILALGVWRMAKRRVLVKKLQAVEALGSAQHIAVDKTGTITKNELVVREIITGDTRVRVAGTGYDPEPKLAESTPDLALAARIAALCSNAHLSFRENERVYQVVGDPTEGALTVFAAKAGIQKEKLDGCTLVNDWPFDYTKKYHAALASRGGKGFLAVTGAPEVLLELSTAKLLGERAAPLEKDSRDKFMALFLDLSAHGFRIIGFAYKDEADTNPAAHETLSGLTFGGFYVMQDALRAGIREQIAAAASAGIRVSMITGDHAATARSIAEEAGIFHGGDRVVTGAELDAMNETELAAALSRASVFARVTPEHKMRIIEAYRKRGDIIAMTGDGVNDAPSLVAADLGIAMGKIGTEVAKEASDIVLLDDNFGDILRAVEEGRNMRAGLRRAITYLFSSNLGEIILIAASLFARDPLPLLAAQIIWMNLVTDTFFDVSLAMEPKDPALMTKRAGKARELFDRLTAARLAVIAPVVGIGGFWLFEGALPDVDRARTIALTALVVFQWFNAWSCRSESVSAFRMKPFSNRFLLITLFSVAVLHFAALHLPFTQRLLSLVPLSWGDWGRIFLVASAVLLVEEIRKFFARRRESEQRKVLYS